jgi:uncharacterized membrane protein
MLETIPLWLHVLAAMVWVGSQVMMFAVVIPAVRTLADDGSRYAILRVMTTRFGYLGLGALGLLVLTGLDNINRLAPGDMFDIRYGYILATKLVMVAVVVVLTLLHTLFIGPAQLRAMAEGDSGPAEAVAARGKLRHISVSVSVVTLLLSLAIVFCAVLLTSGFAYHSA